VYISSFDYLYALDAHAGELLWKKAHTYGANGHVLADEDDLIFCQGNTIYSCYPEDGREKWYYQLDENVEIAAYGMGNDCLSNKVVAVSLYDDGNGNGQLVVLDRFTGVKLWDYSGEYQYVATPTSANGKIFLAGGIFNWFFRVFDEISGEILFEDVNLNYNSQPILANERIFIPTNVGITVLKNKTTSLKRMQSETLEVQVYPNPTYDDVYVKYNVTSPGQTTFYVIDECGGIRQRCEENTKVSGYQTLKMDLSYLANGTYFLLQKSGVNKAVVPFAIIK
jgi:hypothetical protein